MKINPGETQDTKLCFLVIFITYLFQLLIFFYTGKPQENPLIPGGGEITNKQYGASKSVSFVPGADLLDDEEETGNYIFFILLI